MENRRNYYRILHVQPDAPLPLIRASYRTLMQTLKMHPDLGGDHWNATLINEAYATLKDAKARAAYDKAFFEAIRKQRGEPTKKAQPQATPNAVWSFCLFCKTPYIPSELKNFDQEICQECQAPLRRWDTHTDQSQRLPRLEQHMPLNYCTYWPQAQSSAILLDISPQGVKFTGNRNALSDQMIKVHCQLFDAVASVKYCNRDLNGQYTVGAQFQTAQFRREQGVFLKTQA